MKKYESGRAAASKSGKAPPRASSVRGATFARSKRRKSKASKYERAIISAVAALVLLALALGIFLLARGGDRTDNTDDADLPMSVSANQPDEGITPNEATPGETSAASISTPVEVALQTPPPRTTPLLLPVCKRADTTEKVVAITVDDCFDGANLIKIVDAAVSAGGKITVFPIGKNLQDEEVAESIRYAYEKGCEIENHTWSHAGLFDLDDERFAQEIWYQNRMVSMVLGVDYQMHFLRSRGGDNKDDQRTHYYMNQLGYLGYAHWRLIDESGEDYLMRNIRPGDILLFHTNTKDTIMLQSMIPKLAQQGYRLVTLNELYGLPQNEVSELTEETVFEPMVGYTYIMETLVKGDYKHAVHEMQKRLDELGYLKAEYNGYYGSTTENCVRAFQKRAGLKETGVADAATQRALMADNAPRAN